MITPKFKMSSLSLHSVLKKNVNDYFHQNRLSPTGNYKLYIKAGILFSGFASVYIHLIFFTPNAYLAIVECTLLGILTASIGFNIMHDGAHCSFSKYGWLNKSAASTLDLLGANSFMWNVKHNIIHHAYTNINGVE